jgi:hypothetical protein
MTKLYCAFHELDVGFKYLIVIINVFSLHYSQYSSVSIVTDYGLYDRAIEVRFPAEAKEFFLWSLCPDRHNTYNVLFQGQ